MDIACSSMITHVQGRGIVTIDHSTWVTLRSAFTVIFIEYHVTNKKISFIFMKIPLLFELFFFPVLVLDLHESFLGIMVWICIVRVGVGQNKQPWIWHHRIVHGTPLLGAHLHPPFSTHSAYVGCLCSHFLLPLLRPELSCSLVGTKGFCFLPSFPLRNTI